MKQALTTIGILVALAVVRARPAHAAVESRHDHRGSRGAHERSRRRQGAGRCLWQGLSGSAFRRAEAKLHPPRQQADLLVLVGRELEIGWLPPLINSSRNSKIQVGAQWLSRRVAQRQDSRDSDRPDHSRDGRRPSSWQPALLARPGKRPQDRAGDSRQAERAVARGQSVLRPAVRRLRQASCRGREEMGCDRWRRTKARRSSPITDRGRISWNGSGWTSSAMSSRSRAFPRRPRIRST